jgi:hypothetical protein
MGQVLQTPPLAFLFLAIVSMGGDACVRKAHGTTTGVFATSLPTI